MAQGSHRFICHTHVYPWMVWAILHPFRKHSPDGVARAQWRTPGSTYYSICRPWKDERLTWPSWLTYSRRFTHISSHTSGTGRACDRESSSLPVKYWRSTTVQRSQQHVDVWRVTSLVADKQAIQPRTGTNWHQSLSGSMRHVDMAE